jgi:DNA-binding MarR family transcriptional regulator
LRTARLIVVPLFVENHLNFPESKWVYFRDLPAAVTIHGSARQGRQAVAATEGTCSDDEPRHGQPPVGNLVSRHVDRTCRTAVGGRRSARALAAWIKPFGLSEPEFQLLWCLRGESPAGCDQTMLAARLAMSPAQVSALVERLRVSGLIAQQIVAGDRRRNLWQLAAGGDRLLQQVLATVGTLRREISATDAVTATDVAFQRDVA